MSATNLIRVVGDDANAAHLRDQFEEWLKAPFGDFVVHNPSTSDHVTVDSAACTSRITAIKLLRAVTGAGLKEAKDIVESRRFTVPTADIAREWGLSAWIEEMERTGCRVDVG